METNSHFASNRQQLPTSSLMTLAEFQALVARLAAKKARAEEAAKQKAKEKAAAQKAAKKATMKKNRIPRYYRRFLMWRSVNSREFE